MKAVRKQRLYVVAFILVGAAVTVGLLLYAFNQGLNVFYTPTEVADGVVQQGQHFRIGGMVKAGSLVKEGLDGAQIEFVTTDMNKDIPVSYTGVLPDLFREGQGVVADGYIDANGVFQARQILAKHDENYMSPEVKAALEKAAKQKAGTEAGDEAAHKLAEVADQ